MPKVQHTDELASIVSAVEKNSSFRQLATYSINILTKAARKDLQLLDTNATTAVVGALKKHTKSNEMIDCALECLMVLAEDQRQAVTLVESDGLHVSLQAALDMQESPTISKALLHFEKIVGHPRAASLLGNDEMVTLLGKLTQQCVQANDLDSIARCVGAIDQLTRASDKGSHLSQDIVNSSFACLDALSKAKDSKYADSIITACKVAQRGTTQQKSAPNRRQSDAATISRRRRRSTLNTRGSVSTRGSMSARGSITKMPDTPSPTISKKKKAQRRLSMAVQGVSDRSLDTCLAVLQSLGENEHVSSAVGELLLSLNKDSVETLLDAASVEEGEGQEQALLILNAMATSVQGGEAIMWSAGSTESPSTEEPSPSEEGDMGAQRLVKLLNSAVAAEMNSSSNNEAISMGQQRRTLTALSLLAKAARDPVSAQALFEAEVVDVLLQLLQFQLHHIPKLIKDHGEKVEADLEDWGATGVSERCTGILQVLVAMVTSNSKIAETLPTVWGHHVRCVLHACRQSPIDAKLPLTECAVAAMNLLRVIIASHVKADVESVVVSAGAPALLHDTFRVLTWHQQGVKRIHVADLELACLECITAIDEASGDATHANVITQCALSAATATGLMRDEKGAGGFRYQNSKEFSEPIRFKEKDSPEWLHHLLVRRKVVAFGLLRRHAHSLKTEGMKVLDAIASTPRPWPWCHQEELYVTVSNLISGIHSTALCQSVITFVTNEGKAKNRNDLTFRKGVVSTGVDLLDLLLLRPLPSCNWANNYQIREAGLVLGEAGCRTILKVLVADAERMEASWRRGEDVATDTKASAFVMASAISKFKSNAAAKKGGIVVKTETSPELLKIGTVWKLLVLISVVSPPSHSRLPGTLVPVPEVESVVRVAADSVMYSERKPTIEVTAAALLTLGAAASHPDHIYDDILDVSWVTIAVSVSKLLRTTDWHVVDAAALFLRHLAVAATTICSSHNAFDVYEEVEEAPARESTLNLAVQDEGVIALVIQSLRKLVTGHGLMEAEGATKELSVSTIESLLMLLLAASANSDACKVMKSKQPIDMLLAAIDVCESFESEVSGEAQVLCKEAAFHSECLLGKLVEDDDITRLLANERSRLEEEGPKTSVKRLGILLELSARRAFVRRENGEEIEEMSKDAKTRASNLKLARAGGVGLILDALNYAVEQGLDKPTYETIDTFVRTANCHLHAMGEEEGKSRYSMAPQSTLRFTISPTDAKDMLAVTSEEMQTGVELILKALATHAVSSAHGISVATNAIKALAVHHTSASLALVGTVGKLSEDSEEEEEDDFETNQSKSLFESLLPGLRLVHGRGPPQAILSCLQALVVHQEETVDDIPVFNQCRRIMRGALRDHVPKLISVVVESVEGLDLRIDSNMTEVEERFIIASDGINLLIPLIYEEAVEGRSEGDKVSTRLEQLAQEQSCGLMLGVITDICEAMLLVTEYCSAACTLAEKTHSNLPSSLYHLVRNMLRLSITMVDGNTAPLMFEVGLVARLIHLVEYSQFLMRDVDIASYLIRYIHKLCEFEDFHTELANCSAVGLCLNLSSSHPQELELTSLASQVAALLSATSNDDMLDDSSPVKTLPQSPSGENNENMVIIEEEEEEDDEESKIEDKLKREAEVSEKAKQAEEKKRLKQEAKLAREEAKREHEAKVAKIVETCSTSADTSLHSLSEARQVEDTNKVSTVLDEYATQHKRCLEEAIHMTSQEEASQEEIREVVEAVCSATAKKEEATDQVLVSLMDQIIEKEVEDPNLALAVAHVLEESNPSVSAAALRCLQNLTFKEPRQESVIELEEDGEEEEEEPEVYVEEEEITSGWEKIWSDEHDVFYYHNYDTEETVWEEPDEYPAQEASRAEQFAIKKQAAIEELKAERRELRRLHREAELEKKRVEHQAKTIQDCVEKTNKILEKFDANHGTQSSSQLLVEVMKECHSEEEMEAVLNSVTASAREACESVKVLKHHQSQSPDEEVKALNMLTTRLALASEFYLMNHSSHSPELLNLCDETSALVAIKQRDEDSPVLSTAEQAAVSTCSLALWRVGEHGDSKVVERTVENIRKAATSVSAIDAVNRTTKGLVSSGRIREPIKPLVVVVDDDSDGEELSVEAVKSPAAASALSPLSPNSSLQASTALAKAMSSVGSPGSAKSMTTLIHVVTSDPSKISEVVSTLLNSIERQLDLIDDAVNRDLKEEFNEFGRLTQLLHSVCSLSCVTETALNALQPHLSNVLQRGLQTTIRSDSVAQDEQQRLVQICLALLGRLTHIAEVAEKEKASKVMESQESNSSAMKTLTLDVLSETMEVPSVNMIAHKALQNMVTSGGKTTVEIVRNHPVMTKVSKNSSTSVNMESSNALRRASMNVARRQSMIPQLAPRRASIMPSILPEGPEATEQSSTEETIAVLGKFAVSSIVITLHEGDANKVVESLMHITSAKEMRTTVQQIADALLPSYEGSKISALLALEMLLDIAVLIHASGSNGNDSVGLDEGGAFCGVAVLHILFESSLKACFDTVASGAGLERDSTAKEDGILVALATVATSKRMAPLISCIHLDACHEVLQTIAVHPAGLRALSSITQQLLEQLICPPKHFFTALTNTDTLNNVIVNEKEKVLSDIKSNISLSSLLKQSVSDPTAVESNAVARLDRWRRTASLLHTCMDDSKSGRELGAGDAFDAAVIATRAGKATSMDFLMSCLATAHTHMKCDKGIEVSAKGIWSQGFAHDVICAVLALVLRLGGENVGMKNGHVALGTLHEIRQLGESMLSTPSEQLSKVLEEVLSGAPELLFSQLVRSLYTSTTIAASSLSDQPKRRLSSAEILDPSTTLSRCDELVTAMGTGIDNVLPSVGIMLVAISATGFKNSFAGLVGQDKKQEAKRERHCVSECIKLLKRMATSRAQGKLLSSDSATSSNLAQCILNYLPLLVEDNMAENEEEEPEEEANNDTNTEMVKWNCAACTFQNAVPKGTPELACDMCSTPYKEPPPQSKATKARVVRPRAATVVSMVDRELASWFVSMLSDILALCNMLMSPSFFQSLLAELGSMEVSHQRGEAYLGAEEVISEEGCVLVHGRAVCCLFDVLCDSVQRVPSSIKHELVMANMLLLTSTVVREEQLKRVYVRRKQAAATVKALEKWQKSLLGDEARLKAQEAALQNELFGGPPASEIMKNFKSSTPMPPVSPVEVEEGTWAQSSVDLIQHAFVHFCRSVEAMKEEMANTPAKVIKTAPSAVVASSSILLTTSTIISSTQSITMSDIKKQVSESNLGSFLLLLKGIAALSTELLKESKSWSRYYRKELRQGLAEVLFGGRDKSSCVSTLLSRSLLPLPPTEADLDKEKVRIAELTQQAMARVTLDAILQLFEFMADISNNDTCIQLMLFGPLSEGAVPMGDVAVVELIVKQMISAPLWKVASMEEQRNLCSYGLRCLDHFATIDDSTLDAVASKLLLEAGAPAAVIKVLRMQESSIAVQEAAVEALMSFAYSSSAVEVMLQRKCVPLLINIAETYEDASSLVLCCLQTLTLLMKDGGDAFYDFIVGNGIQLFIHVLQSSSENYGTTEEVQAEMQQSALTLLSTMSRSAELRDELSMSPEAVPIIMSFLTRLLTTKSEVEDEDVAVARLEQAVDALKHLSHNSDLNAAIGEYGMHLILQLVGTALNDRNLQLLYLDLIKHLSIHDSNVKALVSKDGITLLLWILTNCGVSENELLDDESERQVVKLQVTILSTLGNMASSHHEYAAVIVVAGAEKVLEQVSQSSKKADHYEVTAAVRDVNNKLQQVTATKSTPVTVNSVTKARPPPPAGSRPPPPPAPTSRPLPQAPKPAVPPPPKSIAPQTPKPSIPPGRPLSTPALHHPASKNIFEAPLAAEEPYPKPDSFKKNLHQSATRRPSNEGGGDQPLMGYLRKQGGGTSMLGRKNWKTRFFVLEGPILFYYENEETRQENKPLNNQPYILTYCDVLLDDKNGVDATKYYFTIKPCGSRGGKGPLVLEAETAAMRARWLTWLNTAQKIPPPANWA